MKIKLLFFIGLSLLLSSCYTHVRYVYVDEPVDEVYIYDVNYVYTNLWYDDFYWRYDVENYCNFDLFGLYFYTSRYWAYPYYYNYKPYWHHRYHHKRHHRLHFRSQPIHRQTYKKLKQRYYLDREPVQIKSRSKYRHKITQRKTIKNSKNDVQLKS
ncbi:hypothetical protein LCGC14_2776640, partial [marine sediment metagenome]